jgi:hypothetical protein
MDLGSGKNLFRIPDPGVKKGTGSRIPDPQPALQDLTALYLENLKTYFETKMHHPVSTHQDKTAELVVPVSIFLIDWYLSRKISL